VCSLFPNVLHAFLQVWFIFQSVTLSSRGDPLFPKVTNFCKCDPFFQVWLFFQVWTIFPGLILFLRVTSFFPMANFTARHLRFYVWPKCDQFFKSVTFFQVWPIFLSVIFFFQLCPAFPQCDPQPWSKHHGTVMEIKSEKALFILNSESTS